MEDPALSIGLRSAASTSPVRIFLTGGSGLLGRRVLACHDSSRWQIHAPSSLQLDLRDDDAVRQQVEVWQPAVVVHTAYRNDRDSIVAATRNVAQAARAVGARLVHVSTDSVFAGREAPYTESDQPSPINDYGRWKLAAEEIVQGLSSAAVIVRTSLLYARDAVCAHDQMVRDALDGARDVVFFSDEIRCPAFADDLAVSLLALAGDPSITGLLHLAGPHAVSRAALATVSCARHGWDATGLRFGTIASSGLTRPGRVVLDSSLAASAGLRVSGPSS